MSWKRVDDVDGSTNQVDTVTFAVDGKLYAIDLSPSNQTKLTQAVEQFTRVATPYGVTPPPPPTPGAPGSLTDSHERGRTRTHPRSSGTPTEATAIRAWAAANGYQMSRTGQVPAVIRSAYEASQRNPA